MKWPVFERTGTQSTRKSGEQLDVKDEAAAEAVAE